MVSLTVPWEDIMELPPKGRGGHSASTGRFPFAFILVHVFLPVVIGAAIYSLWRSKALLVFTWYRWIGLYGPILSLRGYFAGAKHLIPGPILYSLPDGLWVYSFTALMGPIWFQEKQRYVRLLWTLLPVSMAVGAEIGQAVKLVPGTFDWTDIFSYIVAWFLAVFSARGFFRTPVDQSPLRAISK